MQSFQEGSQAGKQREDVAVLHGEAFTPLVEGAETDEEDRLWKKIARIRRSRPTP